MSPKFLSATLNLQHLKKQAKDLLTALRANDPAAHALIQRHRSERSHTLSSPVSAALSLAESQWVIAREYGFASWLRLNRHIEKVT